MESSPMRIYAIKFLRLDSFDTASALLFSFSNLMLTHFSSVSHFYTLWKRQKTFGFLAFSGGIEMWHWTKMG